MRLFITEVKVLYQKSFTAYVASYLNDMRTNSLQGIFKPRAQDFTWLLEIAFVCKLGV